MRRIPIVLALLLAIHGTLGAQGARHGGSHFGAAVVRVTNLHAQNALMFGGRGGWNMTPSLVLGGVLYGTMTWVHADAGTVPGVSYPLDLKFEAFAADLEYHADPRSGTHLTVGTSLGGGAAHYYRDKTNEQEGETDFMLLAEPSVGVERAMSEAVHVHLSATYRIVHGVELAGLKVSDIAGPSLALALKLGRF